jgi:hypothetical protein
VVSDIEKKIEDKQRSAKQKHPIEENEAELTALPCVFPFFLVPIPTEMRDHLFLKSSSTRKIRRRR